MRECTAIRHMPYEDLGYFYGLLAESGYTVRYIDAPQADPQEIEDADPDLLIVLGGPVGANDELDYPFLTAELAQLQRRLAENRPTLGICLGGQLMARALGAVVQPAPRSEVGWIPLDLSEAGKASVLRHLGEEPVFHWHGDMFNLPQECTSLASTPDCPHQAYLKGSNLLGLQFHPEVTARGLETWYVGHYRALRADREYDVPRLRQNAIRNAESLRRRGMRMLTDWLNQLEY